MAIAIVRDSIPPAAAFNRVLGILGIFALGIFLDWFPLTVLHVPWPRGLLSHPFADGGWQTVTTIIIPCAWAIWRLGLRPADLGLSTKGLGRTLLLGCALYSLALAAFVHCAGDPLIAHHILGRVGLGDAIGLTAAMSLVAAGTDIATRGFLLLTLSRYTHVGFAILVQNLAWYLGHINEIGLLTGCLGYYGALGLTLTLGILGDVVALRTRNVVGLSLAHILLNIAMAVFIRHL